MVRRYFSGVLLAVLAMLFVIPAAMARDRCNCAGVCSPACNCGCAFDGPGILQSPVIRVGVPGPVYRSQGAISVGIPQTAFVGNSREYRTNSRAERRSHGGSRLSGHSTDHWSQQLNWGRP